MTRLKTFFRINSFASFILIFSLGLLAFSLFENNRYSATTSGVVSERESNICAVYVKYFVNDIEYEKRLPDRSGKYSCRDSEVGAKRMLRYDPQNPYDAGYEGGKNEPYFWAITGMSAFAFILIRQRQIKRPRLQE